MKALAVQDLSKRYKNGTQALNGVSFSVDAGECLAILGPNGAGKSTLINIITALVTKSSGSISAFGLTQAKSANQVKQFIGVVPQEFNFSAFASIQSILHAQAGFYGLSRRHAQAQTKKYLTLFQLWDKRNDNVRSLSGGMKRRLMLARALLHEPKILILDEPTAGVDIELRRLLWDLLRDINAKGTTIILTTHYLEEAENLCQRIIVLDEGVIKEDTPTRLLLSKLDKERFVLDCTDPIDTLPSNDTFHFKKVDAHTLEVEIPKNCRLNELFKFLDKNNIGVHSLRNKTNRLEETFVQLTQKSRHR